MFKERKKIFARFGPTGWSHKFWATSPAVFIVAAAYLSTLVRLSIIEFVVAEYVATMSKRKPQQHFFSPLLHSLPQILTILSLSLTFWWMIMEFGICYATHRHATVGTLFWTNKHKKKDKKKCFFVKSFPRLSRHEWLKDDKKEQKKKINLFWWLCQINIS